MYCTFVEKHTVGYLAFVSIVIGTEDTLDFNSIGALTLTYILCQLKKQTGGFHEHQCRNKHHIVL
jgi:hypothetical protein